MGSFTTGLKNSMNAMSRPRRITTDIKPGNPVQGLKSLTGQPETATMSHPIAQNARKAMKPISHTVSPGPGMKVR